jgi:hypothetical protein
MTAGALVILFIGRLIPTGQPGFAAVASLFVAAAVIDCGAAWGAGVWAASAALGFVVSPGSPSVWMYALFFGYYPIVKLIAEKRFPKAASWIAKLFVFYAGLTAALILAGVAAGFLGRYGAWVIPAGIVAGTAVFVLFDIGYGRLIEYYRLRISRKR